MRPPSPLVQHLSNLAPHLLTCSSLRSTQAIATPAPYKYVDMWLPCAAGYIDQEALLDGMERLGMPLNELQVQLLLSISVCEEGEQKKVTMRQFFEMFMRVRTIIWDIHVWHTHICMARCCPFLVPACASWGHAPMKTQADLANYSDRVSSTCSSTI